MLTDYHSHTPLCHHATGTIDEYIERALEAGLTEFGISDHSPWMIQKIERPLAMRWDELPGYVDAVSAAQDKYNRTGPEPFAVRLGLEMDYVPSRLDQAREVIERYPWDYLLGSIHHVGFWGVPNPSESGLLSQYRIEDVYELYFEVMGRLIDSRFCDVLAHFDLPKKFGHRPDGGAMRWVEPLIPRIKAAGLVVEVNTSGLDNPAHEVLPDWGIIAALNAAGVPLTLCSDAHAPEQVARHFAPVLARLRETGVTHLTRFERRQPELYSIG